MKAEQTEIVSLTVDKAGFSKRMERKRFTRSKPRKTSGSYHGASSMDTIRQAYGMAGRGSKKENSNMIQGAPKQAASAVIEIWKKEGLLDQE